MVSGRNEKLKHSRSEAERKRDVGGGQRTVALGGDSKRGGGVLIRESGVLTEVKESK